jgi:hypothetical protein
MFLAYQHRIETDNRRFGELLYRIMTLAGKKLKKLGSYCEKTETVFFDAVMNTALQ